jgi:hypothetical protein
MRKTQTLGLAIIAVLALSAFVASPAFAEEAEILLGGSKLTESIPAEGGGEFTVVDTGAPGVPELLCSWKYDTEIVDEAGHALLSFVLEFLNLEALNIENMIECEDMKGVCLNPVLFTALLLPWHIEYTRIAGPIYRGTYLNEVNKVQTYDTLCETLVGNVEDTCEETVTVELLSESSGLLEEFGEAAGTKKGECSLGGKESFLITGSDLLTSTKGLLSISE